MTSFAYAQRSVTPEQARFEARHPSKKEVTVAALYDVYTQKMGDIHTSLALPPAPSNLPSVGPPM
jgi:hypothetical protein